MKLYLIQHGISEPKEVDPDRPLTMRGKDETRRMAEFIRSGVEAERILHSGKTRAKQTAEIFAEHLDLKEGVEAAEGLDPLEDPQLWAKRLEGEDRNLMLVGHLPHLSRLASLLLCGDPQREVIRFRNSGVVCLERDDQGRWSLQWMVTPEVVG